MNKAFATFTPRVRPLEYDAIAGRDGCEPESGNDFFGLRAFEELCVSPHDADSLVFAQPATASYSFGPYDKGVPIAPFLTQWSVWVATAGVRAGKVGLVVPPANGTGEASALYPATTPTQITHAWSSEGLLAIAIQKDATHIELKQYDDATGADIDTYTWEGVSPALFYTGHVVRGDDAPGLVCYYLKASDPTILYARFERDLYAEERIILPSVRVPLARLVGAASYDTKVLLYALDDRGRDITLTTPRHPATSADAATLDTAFVSGNVYEVGVEAGVVGLDAATLDIAAPFGQVYDPLVEPTAPPPAEASSLSVAFVGGEVQ